MNNLPQDSKPKFPTNWSRLVGWWETGDETWDNLKEIVTSMLASQNLLSSTRTDLNIPRLKWSPSGCVPSKDGYFVRHHDISVGFAILTADRDYWKSKYETRETETHLLSETIIRERRETSYN